jgi:predicted Zn-dependent protease
LLFLLLAILGTIAAAAGPLSRNLPAHWENALGDALALQTASHFGGYCKAPAGQAALDTIAHRLSPPGSLPFPVSLRAVKSTSVNAFALPGGHVVLTSGLISDAESPDQIAAATALELAHLALHHVTEAAVRQVGLGLGVLMMTGAPTGLAESPLSALLNLSYSHEAEVEATNLGLDLLEKVDIPVQSMGNFFRVEELKERVRGVPSPFRAAHPTNGKRSETAVIQPFTRPTLNDREWQSLRTICD